MATAPARTTEVPWREFCEHVWRWRQGEHVTLIGPNGCGKTTLARELLSTPDRRHVAVLSTKRRDPVIDEFAGRGFRVIRRWNVADPDLTPRVILAPKIMGFADIPKQRRVFREALDAVFRQGAWCVYADEARFLTDYLKLDRELQVIWQQGRSHGISLVAGVQRPRHIPLVAYDQARHHFYWRTSDREMLRRLGELCGAADPEAVREAIASLDSHSVIYVNTVTGELCRTRVPEELAS